ncbi:hypothetical protein EWZ31_04650 [Salmonella enterica subsp. enterica serovar Enteritidis]|nr:hypothetical protein [Salmonella enterica subsp. enterica serovar Enteritidis]
MNNVYDNVLSEKTKSILRSYFVLKNDCKYNKKEDIKKEVDDLFLSVFNDANVALDGFYSFVKLSSDHIQNEARECFNIIFDRIRKEHSVMEHRMIMYINESHKKESDPNYEVNPEIITFKQEFKNYKNNIPGTVIHYINKSSIDVDEETKKTIADILALSLPSGFKNIEGSDLPVFNFILNHVLNKIIVSYKNYIVNFLAKMIFKSDIKINYGTLNKKPDKKGHRGPIKRNIETQKLVFTITSATVGKYPNVSDDKLAKAIQKHLTDRGIGGSYNTVKKWVKERREQEGTIRDGEESYKGVISLVMP